MRILFVSTGNLIRSPIALAVAQSAWATFDGSVEFDAAGTYPVPGAGVPLEAILAADAIGINLRDYRAKPITDELVHSSDLILAADTQHREELAALYPISRRHVFTLLEFEACAELVQSSAFSFERPSATQASARQFVSTVSHFATGGAMSGTSFDIPDPLGFGQEEFDLVAARIQRAVLGILETLRGPLVTMDAALN